MKTRESMLLAFFLVAGIALVGAGYYLFLHDAGDSPIPFEKVQTAEERKSEEPPEITTEIEGYDPELEEETLPTDKSSEVGAITGVVKNKEKQPIADARVFVFRSKSPITPLTGKLKPLDKTQTDEEGRFRFSPLYTGAGYRVVAEHDEYMPEALDSITVEPKDDTEVPDLILYPGKVVYGTVKDHQNRPISGALVELFDPMSLTAVSSRRAEPRQMGRTDEKGEYTLPQVKDVNFLVRASAPGYETKIEQNTDLFTNQSRMKFNFLLMKEKTLQGQVIDELDKPVPGAVVYATHMRTKQRATTSAVTDEKGRFVIGALSEGVYYMSAVHERYSTHSLPDIPAGEKDLLFKLKLRSGISGQVVDENREPVTESFWINIRLTSARPDGYVPQTMKKKFKHKEGRFSFEGVEPGTYFMEVISAGFAPFKAENIVVKRDVFKSDLLIQLDRGGTITGLLYDAKGSPLAGARVQLRRNTYRPNPVEHYFGASTDIRNSPVKTNRDGEYKIEKIPEGVYQLEFSHKGFPNCHVRDIQVTKNRETEVAAQYMKQGATLQGRVYNDANTPLAGVRVNVRNQDNTVNLETTSNSKGYYKINKLPPGKYLIAPIRKLKPDESPFTLIGSMKKNEIKDIELVEGQVRDLNIIIYS